MATTLRRPRSKKWLLVMTLMACAPLLTLTSSQQVLANDAALSKEAKLQQLKKQIRDLRTTLTKSTSQKNKLQLQLQQNETVIGNTVLSLNKLDSQLKLQQRELQAKQQEKKTQSSELQQQQQLLAQQIRASYAMGNQGYAKILLNQQDPAAIGRTLIYYDYLNQSRTQSIKTIDGRITALSRLESDIRQKQQQIQTAQQQRQQEKSALETQRHSRQQVLTRIEKDIKSQAQRLVQLEETRKTLEALLAKLSKVLADIPAEVGDIKPFHQLKGRLIHPANGRMNNHFGKHRKGGNLKWQGVTISAKTGARVNAIHHGRIAFSDWLRGFGLLVIIDHGDGYMSLYGHNESLYKDVGEWVETGETVATVGESGGQSSTGLYFEIRKNGKPLNPKSWLAHK